MSANTRRRKRKVSSQYDANQVLPRGLTQLVVDEVNSLPSSVKVDYLKKEFISKFVSSETDPANVRRQRAINKWLATERTNEATNDRLLTLPEDYHILPRVHWSAFLSFLQESVLTILGDTIPVDALFGGFSGGASTSKSRTESHPALKYLGKADITASAIDWFNLVLDEAPAWADFSRDREELALNVVAGNVLFTVPKNTTIDRCAAKEPDLNMYLQKGAGRFIRSRLRQFGIDLNDQSRNRRLARAGSLSGELATVDLSSASDSISKVLVELVLPPIWWSFLDSIRSPVTVIDGEVHVNEMFSSMGNGFTFELESLLFYCVTRTVAYFTGTRGVVSVYGDDIICPSSIFQDLSWVLQVLGFEVNPSKSFHTGTFRESCGGHYDSGNDITPFYLRRPIEKLTDVILVCNNIRRWSTIEGFPLLDDALEELYTFLISFVPEGLRGGQELGDSSRASYPVDGRRRLVAVQRKAIDSGHGGYLHWLDSCWENPARLEAVETSKIREVVPRYRLRRVNYSDRFDLPVFMTEV